MSDNESDNYSLEEEGDENSGLPTYSAEEIADTFLDFYKFLTTLHYNAADLKVAPEEGWGELIPDNYAEIKSEEVLEVLRRLPYFKHNNQAFHYKSYLVDYTAVERDFFDEEDERMEYLEIWCNDGEIVDQKHCIHIAWGYESGGREFVLNVLHGEITEDMLEVNQLDFKDIPSFFDELKEQYRTLKLIPCIGRETLEADSVPEREDEVTEEEFKAQTEENFPTDLDIQYIRQLYRKHGWPEAFRREECFRAAKELSDSLEAQGRYGWPEVDESMSHVRQG